MERAFMMVALAMNCFLESSLTCCGKREGKSEGGRERGGEGGKKGKW